eukprot:gene5728-213_t
MASVARIGIWMSLGCGMGFALSQALPEWEPALSEGHHRGEGVAHGIIEAIGNTPLIELPSLSKATGCRILVKAESMNPGGSVKDRPARQLILEAEKEGLLSRNGECIVEGTGGNTGVGLAMLAAALGYEAKFSMPEAISGDKVRLMRLFGAETFLQPAVPFSHDQHYYQVAQRLGSLPKHFAPDQFENTNNALSHYLGTGPEIWNQTSGDIDAFTCAAGTGGTMAGCSMYLKEKNPNIKIILLDPEGSGLYSFVKGGSFQSNGKSVTEGIGISRLTKNFAKAKVDDAIRVYDQEAIDMAYYLLHHEGIFTGPSASLNIVGAVKVARQLGPGHTVVTILCDTGDRYLSTIYNEEWLLKHKLTPSQSTNMRGDLSFIIE